MDGTTGKIIRRTIHTFFKNYHFFTSLVAFLAFPASVCLLFNQFMVPSSSIIFRRIHFRVLSLFEAAGFPASADLFVALNVKFSQTIFTYVFTLPFTVTFLLLAKACIITILCRPTKPRQLRLQFLSSSAGICPSLLWTNLFGSFVTLSANAAVFSFLFVVFNVADAFRIISPNANFILSTAGAVMYSIVLAHVTVACNLAIVVAGVENRCGFLTFLKAFLLVKGRAATALSLTLIGNLTMAAVETLFKYRVVNPYLEGNRLLPSTMLESVSIAYIHSLVVILDVIATCVFFNSCKMNRLSSLEADSDSQFELLEQEDDHSDASAILKLQELPLTTANSRIRYCSFQI